MFTLFKINIGLGLYLIYPGLIISSEEECDNYK